MKKHVAVLGTALLTMGLAATMPAAGALAASAPPASATSTPGANLRVSLDQLLGEHAVLAELAMQAGYAGAADYPQLTKALGQNTQELSDLVASVYGKAAGRQFQVLWQSHINDLVDYVLAAKRHDVAGQMAAMKAMTSYRDSFSAFMAKADPFINASRLSAALQKHMDQLMASFNAFVAGKYRMSAQDMVSAYNFMFVAGDYLAVSIAKQYPSTFNNTSPNTLPVHLRVTLDQLLGAHAILAQLAMESGYAGSPQYPSWVYALNQNTQALSGAIASVYGPAAGKAFTPLWQSHINDMVHYVVATKAHDAAGQMAAMKAMTSYRDSFSAFMAKADPYISASALSATLQHHMNQLLASFHAFAAGKYQLQAKDFGAAYDYMFTAGAYLSSGIVAQYPQMFGLRK